MGWKERPIRVEAALTVEAEPRAGITGSQALEALFADPGFGAWLPTVPRQRWQGPELRWRNGVWRFTLRIAGPEARAVVEIDALTGEVGPVRIEPPR